MASDKGTAAPAAKPLLKAATKAQRERFLAELAVTSNVAAAARAAGLEPSSLYRFRHRDPEFARQWDEALQHSYQHLETELVRHALSGAGCDAAGEASTIDPDLALKLLALGRGTDPQGRRAGGKSRFRLKQPSEQDVLLSLHRKLTAMEKKLERKR